MMKQIVVNGQAFEAYSWDRGKSWVSTNASGNKAILTFLRRQRAELSCKLTEQELRWIDAIDEGKKYPRHGSNEQEQPVLHRQGLHDADQKKIREAVKTVRAAGRLPTAYRNAWWDEKQLCWREFVTPEKRLMAWKLWVEDGLTQREIAERMGVPPGTVGNWIAFVKRGDLLKRGRWNRKIMKSELRILLTEEDRKLLSNTARVEGVSMAEFIRRSFRERAGRILSSETFCFKDDGERTSDQRG